MKQIEGAKETTGIEWGDYLGKLMVVEPLEVEKDIKTVHGPSDAVRANVYVVRSKTGEKFDAFEDVLIFPRGLQRQTKGRIGKIVAGRLTQGAAQKGQNPPWLLAAPDEADLRATRGMVAALNVASASEAESYDDGFEEAPAAPAGKAPAAPSDDGEF